MRIGIDGRMYLQSGVGRYIRNLVTNLQTLDKENDYFIFLLNKDFEELSFNQNFHKIIADIKWYGFDEQTRFPAILKKYKLDLVHFPHFNMPIFYSGKFIVTIHDLIHQNFQMRRATTLDPITYKIKQLGYNTIFKTAIKKSEKILVPSNYVKDQLVKKWKVDSQKIIVTYEAVDEKILKIKNKHSLPSNERQISKRNSLETVLNLKVKPPYIFYVGNAHPHKNVEGLIKAFFRIKGKAAEGEPRQSRESRVKDLQLVLAGHDHYFWQRVKNEFNQKDIIYTGYISDEELVSLYKKARCFVMPSFEEGFGIPILEAMACECPVVSSNAGALPEIGWDACLYFDPNNLEDISEKIMEVLNSEKLKRELIEKGNKRCKQFSWERLAKQTLASYNNV